MMGGGYLVDRNALGGYLETWSNFDPNKALHWQAPIKACLASTELLKGLTCDDDNDIRANMEKAISAAMAAYNAICGCDLFIKSSSCNLEDVVRITVNNDPAWWTKNYPQNWQNAFALSRNRQHEVAGYPLWSCGITINATPAWHSDPTVPQRKSFLWNRRV